MNHIPEPPINPDEDTNPSIAFRPADLEERLAKPATPKQALGLLSLVGASLFTLATLVILFLPNETPPSQTVVPTLETVPTITPEIIQSTDVAIVEQALPTQEMVISANEDLPPIISSQQLSNLLAVPLNSQLPLRIAYTYNPFTIINGDRPRSDFVEYTVVSGDTMDAIANLYNLEAESIAWCNDRRIVQVLRPGDVVLIPPANGACHRVLGTREETINSIAAQYKVTNPYDIIDSVYNEGRLPVNLTPDAILPGGTRLFIPGGVGEIITWNPGTTLQQDGNGNVIGVTFAPGQVGSCGGVTPGGGAYWTNPLPNGTWVRGFYAGHSGIDLAAATGTPILAANSGNVLFAGFSRWGYGNAVVIEHGPYISTLYGHMNSINVSCGQYIVPGQVIGFVGSTGNSSGPHLHFEIRSGDTPTDPSGTAGIGW